ncbi:pyridoxal phosphate-dependent aminotransferase [Burkholderia glumae]|uniref:pyridoxal phosphate-dependent aminotransferase n=1 Tax=Burkholderia glumae TaxID=337 RepID=UPI0013738D20|nr:pyridoxal phosphate-dependent aminotransferase [Burkholderia glumae]QHP89710.1 pyridoxal phosphate-dependent aminotransferase [Burkholderia glumae]
MDLVGNEVRRAPAPWGPRACVESLRPSLIREVANAGAGVDGVLPFWFGESDRVTPAFIREAAGAALADGNTFYTHNLGTAVLRETLAAYVAARHGVTRAAQIAVTSAGVSALMLAAQLLVGGGDRVVALTPLWPNLVEIPKILGAHVECVALDHGEAGWRLDLDRLLAALAPDTRMLLVNSPNNPTGWTMSRAEQAAVLEHCRRHGIWIVADEVYERLAFAAGGASSFLDLASRDERVIVVNSFSKAWAMTGWRLGWLVAPERVMDGLSKLIEYNTSCAPGFVQAAGVAAVRDGEPFVAEFVGALRSARDHLVAALNTLPEVSVAAPDGAMYLFLRLPGVHDSLAFCKRLVREAGVGLAPGRAFGDEGGDFVRWCYACSTERLDAGVQRLQAFLRRTGA